MDLCDQPQLDKSFSVQSMIERAERQGSPVAAALSRQAVARFCDGPVDLHPTLEAAWFNHDALLYQAEPRLHRLDELVALLADPEVAATARAEASSLVGELLAETDSFFVFQHVGSEAAQRGLLRTLLPASGVLPRGRALQDDVAGNAVLLAACQRFGGCGAGTPLAVIQCLAHCERPMGLVDQVYWRLPPSQVDAVERVAAWLRTFLSPAP
jgi:hypothetical protein